MSSTSISKLTIRVISTSSHSSITHFYPRIEESYCYINSTCSYTRYLSRDVTLRSISETKLSIGVISPTPECSICFYSTSMSVLVRVVSKSSHFRNIYDTTICWYQSLSGSIISDNTVSIVSPTCSTVVGLFYTKSSYIPHTIKHISDTICKYLNRTSRSGS